MSEVIVTIQKEYTSSIRSGSHTIIADEPASLGGQDMGPDPYALLMGSLGSCTTITMRMYADRKKWPLEGAVVTLKYTKVHAKDCLDCESKSGYIHEIQRDIELQGNLTEEQKEKLLDIANKCPVHKMLMHEIKVRSSLK